MKDNYGDYDLFAVLLNKSVGKTIRKIRTEKHMTQEDLIKKMDNVIKAPTLSRYESGNSNIRMNILLKFAKAFDMTPQQLIDTINDTYLEDIKKDIKVLEQYYDL